MKVWGCRVPCRLCRVKTVSEEVHVEGFEVIGYPASEVACTVALYIHMVLYSGAVLPYCYGDKLPDIGEVSVLIWYMPRMPG